jgi:AcrR family transcriptional regulator
MPRPSRSAEKRSQLLPEVARTFSELGYRRTTTAELARRCGVRENILYRLWPDKKAMFIASIEYVYALSSGIWRDVLQKDAPPGTAAERLLSYEARHHGEFGFYRIVFAGLNESHDPEIRSALRTMYARFHRFICDQIRAHRRGPHASDVVLAAWAVIGLGTVANIGREFDLLSAVDRERLMKDIGSLLISS